MCKPLEWRRPPTVFQMAKRSCQHFSPPSRSEEYRLGHFHLQIIFGPKSRGWFFQFQPAESPVKSSTFTGGQSDQGLATEDEWGNIIRLGRRIHIPDNAGTALYSILSAGPNKLS